MRWRTKYGEVSFEVPEGIYEPDEDTLLLLDVMEIPEGARVLEVGCGCGVVSLAAAGRASLVVATDVNAKAAAATHKNALANGLHSKVIVVCCDVANALKRTATFDVVLFNSPYLPVKGEEVAWSGGRGGVEVALRLIKKLGALLKPNGKAFIVTSSLGRLEEITKVAIRTGLTAEVIREKKQFFETIYVVKIARPA